MDLYILNTSFEQVEIIDNYRTLVWNTRFQEPGEFELALYPSENILHYVKQDNYVRMPGSDVGMVIQDFEFSSDDDGPQLVVSGPSLEELLGRRLVWNEYMFQEESVETIVQKLLNDNVIAPTNANRKINSVIYTASGDTAISELKVTMQLDGSENLLAVIEELCARLDIGFKMRFTSNNKIAFQLYSGANRSKEQDEIVSVTLAPSWGNLSDTKYLHMARGVVNHAYIWGEQLYDEEGYPLARMKTTADWFGADRQGIYRREVYVDASGLRQNYEDENGEEQHLSDNEYKELLQYQGLAEMTENRPVDSFAGTIDPGVSYVYGEDYFLGDIVQIEDGFGHSMPSRITEVVVSHNSSGECLITPTFRTY